ncbi:unnamed protein product [Vicia faba]|uniref:Bifunctional inhibitor/plant lipid transfer protein/seed storage helical domain-containing protein n=1 Tax=Vicia faba TaxID=3906 RepID=A0AAV1A5E9_VICFA|nr:unnamed protein product [Vicia faba]
MASNKFSALIVILSLLSYSTFSHACGSCNPKPKPSPPPTPKPCPPPKVSPPTPSTTPPTASPPTPSTTPPTASPPTPSTTPPTASPPTPSTSQKCPKDTLKLGVCSDLLGLVNVALGSPASSKCCALIQGLADLDAAICLCTAIKANVLGINLNVPITLSLLLSACEKSVPSGFQCS